MEVYGVSIVDLNTGIETALSVEVNEAETTDDIVIKATVSGQEIISLSYNYLPAYREFRDELLRLGFGLKCNGSRLNAVQSGMMGTVDKVYLVEMGKQALMKDVVSIWDYADINDFPDTRRQLAFLEKWFGSLP